MSLIAETPGVPYFAVIFTSVQRDTDVVGVAEYAEMLDRMLELAAKQAGYLGIESAREEVGITVSYWESLEAIEGWKRDVEHVVAQRRGREDWYAKYRVRVCRVERDYGWG